MQEECSAGTPRITLRAWVLKCLECSRPDSRISILTHIDHMFALPARPASGHFLLALRYSASVANQWKVPRRPISTAIRDNSALKKARYALKSLSQEPDSETKLKIYALYKQVECSQLELHFTAAGCRLRRETQTVDAPL